MSGSQKGLTSVRRVTGTLLCRHEGRTALQPHCIRPVFHSRYGQYKGMAFSRKVIRHIFPMTLGKRKGFSEGPPEYLILHKKAKPMHYHTVLVLAKSLAKRSSSL